MKIGKIILLCLFILGMSNNLSAQIFLNLDFEKSSLTGTPLGCEIIGKGYSTLVDTVIRYSGKKSLRIISESYSPELFGATVFTLPVEYALGKHLKFSGYIKTESISEGYAGLWCRIDGKDKNGNLKVMTFDNMLNRGASGTKDWTKYEIEMDVNNQTTNINFGVLLQGNGMAWFDNLQLIFDDIVFQTNEDILFNLSNLQLFSLKEKAIKIKTANPNSMENDLEGLRDLVKKARIVALGEGTHGTSEFFKLKHRIIKFLAEEMGFTIFAIEANLPEARKINEYVLNGTGDPKELLSKLYFWTWNTQEVLDMIEWMREFNRSKKGRIEFWGFDMQFTDEAKSNISKFFKNFDPQYSDSLDIKFNKIKLLTGVFNKNENKSQLSLEIAYRLAKEILDRILLVKNIYAKTLGDLLTEEIIQDAKIVVQSISMYLNGGFSRDESMATNCEWIIKQVPQNSKIILWAHNAHVSKNSVFSKSMGSYLFDRYSEDMIVFGFSFYEGSYISYGNKGLGEYKASPSEVGSIELILHKVGLPNFILDLRGLNKLPNFNWLNSRMYMRSVGAIVQDYEFYQTIIPSEYDVIIFCDKSNPSSCFALQSKN